MCNYLLRECISFTHLYELRVIIDSLREVPETWAEVVIENKLCNIHSDCGTFKTQF